MRHCAPNFCPYFGEATASSQQMYSVLLAQWSYTGRILSMRIAYMLKSEELGHILVVFGKFGKRISIGEAWITIFNAFFSPEAL